jgi:membrane protease YdiL (CAAX protease family)
MSLTSFLFTRLSQALGGRLKFLSFFDEFVRKTLIPIFSQVNTMDILLIASVSGFAEELFFRGVLQAQLGIVIASIIFGLFHFTGPRYLFYVIWAALAGYFMGLLLDRFHTLWVPILAHATNNFISIAMLRFRVGYRDTSEES